MDEPQSPWEIPMGDVFSEVPLFREIQRVLLSSTGPVNWELARQVGIAAASWGKEDPAPSEQDQRAFEDAARVAELRVADFTGLNTPIDVARIEAVRRSQWVQSNIEGLKELVEPAAAKLGAAVTKAQREAAPPEAVAFTQQMLGQLSPL
ncbi:MAG: zinc-dependent metalloprotease, partial [Actinobacteria bacterium]|nr:zinc-dependent metalloprotease [Actinomycetota bacterium]